MVYYSADAVVETLIVKCMEMHTEMHLDTLCRLLENLRQERWSTEQTKLVSSMYYSESLTFQGTISWQI